MSDTTRKTALAGTTALPLAPMVATARGSRNATDAIWREYTSAVVKKDNAIAECDRLSNAELDAACEPAWGAEDRLLGTLATSLVDLERKLAILDRWRDDDMLTHEHIAPLLADARNLIRKGAA